MHIKHSINNILQLFYFLQGRFEILSLSGSFTPGEVEGISSREGGMSIALSSPDGRVVGGLLGGILTAAGPVQVPFDFFRSNNQILNSKIDIYISFKTSKKKKKKIIDYVKSFFTNHSKYIAISCI